MRTPLWTGLLLLVAVTACGGSGGAGADKASQKTGSSSSAPGKDTSSMFSSTPVQLTVDPCTLVTQEEAQTTLGHPATEGLNGTVCTYTANGNGGHIAVETVAPDFCKLLFLALKNNLFGGAQVRVDDVGDGGMLVKGNGNVQFVVHGGCVSVDATVGDTHPPDDTVLSLARTAAGRVS